MSRRAGSRPRSRSPWMNPATYRSSGLNAYESDALSPYYPRSEHHALEPFCLLPEDRYDSAYSSRSMRERSLIDRSAFATDELVRSRNLQVQMANASIAAPSRYVEIHPKLCQDGRYPDDFEMPVQLGALATLSAHRLDRILMDYATFTDGGVYRGLYAQTYASELGRGLSHQSQFTKIAALLDFLGASRLAAVIRRTSAWDHMDLPRTSLRGRRR